jgi:hypothetical protein
MAVGVGRGPRARLGRVVMAMALAAPMWLAPPEASAQPSVPFEHFVQLGDSALANVEIRFIPMSPSNPPWPALRLTVVGADSTGRPAPPPAGAAATATRMATVKMPSQASLPSGFQTPPASAPPSAAGGEEARATLAAGEMRSVIERIARSPAARRGFVDSTDVYALTMTETGAGFPRVYQTTLVPRAAGGLCRALAVAVASSAAATEALGSIACLSDGDAGPPPGEITDDVQVLVDHFAVDPARRELECRLRVINRSGRPILGPLDVAVRVQPASVQLIAPDSFACRAFERTAPVVRIRLDGTLAPGAVAERAMRLRNPRQRDVRFGFRVFSGAADR